MKKDKVIHLSGMRKQAMARATLKPGKGVIRVNKVLLDNFGTQMCRQRILEPAILAGDLMKTVDIDVHVYGGGATTQADAIRLAIARSLNEHSKDKLKSTYVEYDRTLMVADVRVKERRKPNCHGKARSKVQKSYR